MTPDSGRRVDTGGPGNRSWAQWFCLNGGAFLLVRGTVGLALDPAVEASGKGWHQLFHLGSGAVLLAASRQPSSALALTLGFAAVTRASRSKAASPPGVGRTRRHFSLGPTSSA